MLVGRRIILRRMILTKRLCLAILADDYETANRLSLTLRTPPMSASERHNADEAARARRRACR